MHDPTKEHLQDPTKEHLQTIQRIFRYLKATPGKGILFKKGSNLKVEAYTNAGYAGSLIDKRSTTGYCTFIGGNLVT